MPREATDRNLLFGILAVQMDFISRDALVSAMHAWVLAKAKPLGQILQEQNALTPDTRALLEALVQKHLALHNNDPQQSLAAVSSVASVKRDLEQITDPDVQQSIVSLPQAAALGGGFADDPYATTAAAGKSTIPGVRFRILRPHAKGGLGEVFVAHDEELHREVALKEIQNRHADNQESRARFMLEAEITGGLEHPGIVPVYGLGQYADGRPFYAMRFIRGDSLQDAIEKYHNPPPSPHRGRGAGGEGESDRNLEFRKLLGRFIDVCQAMQYAHDRGVLHRDLKPGNIMLGKYGETLVVDWGLAKAVGAKSEPEAQARDATEPMLTPKSISSSAETVAGTAVGTPAFMSPEQAAGRIDLLGPASDVYSLGATLYTLLTGKTSVEDRDLGVALKKVQLGEFPRPREIKPDVDRALEAVCLKAMALNPADRYATPLQLADDIEHWLGDEPVSALREPVTVKVGRWARKHKSLVSGAVATILMGLITGTAAFMWHQEERAQKLAAETLREAELKRKQALAEQAIVIALDQAEKKRDEFQQTMRKPGGVFKLLNEPNYWQAQIQVAKAGLDRAQVLLTNADAPANRELNARVQRLEALLSRDAADRSLALRLEEIRLTAASTQGGKLVFDANKEYQRAFTEGGIFLLKDDPSTAGRISSSPIKEQLVAALDTWAFNLARAEKDQMERLFLVARSADPDTAWKDRLRQVAMLDDPKAFADLLKRAPISKLSPATLYAMALRSRFGAGSSELHYSTFLRAALTHYPTDFWLNHQFGWYLIDKPAIAEGYFRASLAIRPSSSRSYMDLALTLHRQNRIPEAISAVEKAIEFDPKNSQAYEQLGVLLIDHAGLMALQPDQKKLTEAVLAFRKAIEFAPQSYFADRAGPREGLGRSLILLKRWNEALRVYQEAVKLDSNYALGYIGIAEALSMQDLSEPAIAALKNAIEVCNKAIARNPMDGAAKKTRALAREFLLDLTRKTTDDPRVKSVKMKAQEVGRATIAGDWGKVADLTYPSLIKLLGGREKAIAIMDKAVGGVRQKGIKLRSFQTREPGEFHIDGKTTYVVIPNREEYDTPNGKMLINSYLLGISQDGGKSWLFLDGNGLSDPMLRKKLLSQLPEAVVLPAKEDPIFEPQTDKCAENLWELQCPFP